MYLFFMFRLVVTLYRCIIIKEIADLTVEKTKILSNCYNEKIVKCIL